jgi:phosphoribosylformylglycinamidine (FGAM) synthase-like enzyme
VPDPAAAGRGDLVGALEALIGSPDLASKRWIWEQYDHLVRGDTLQRPGGDAGVIRLRDDARGLAVTTDCTPRYCVAHPETGGAQAVAEAWRNITATGARPLAITDCMNFGSPERPAIMGQFVGCIRGMAAACRALDFPVVSGNVSFYNETNGVAVHPTPAIGGIGLLDDVAGMATIALKQPGDVLVEVGETSGHLGASLYLRHVCGREDGPPPAVDLAAERRNGDFVRSLIAGGTVSACHDVADGGLLVAVAEMALASMRPDGSGVGATVSFDDPAVPRHALAFGEDQARYVIAVAPERLDAVSGAARAAGVPIRRLGHCGGDALTVTDDRTISLSDLARIHEGWLPAYMAGEPQRG